MKVKIPKPPELDPEWKRLYLSSLQVLSGRDADDPEAKKAIKLLRELDAALFRTGRGGCWIPEPVDGRYPEIDTTKMSLSTLSRAIRKKAENREREWKHLRQYQYEDVDTEKLKGYFAMLLRQLKLARQGRGRESIDIRKKLFAVADELEKRGVQVDIPEAVPMRYSLTLPKDWPDAYAEALRRFATATSPVEKSKAAGDLAILSHVARMCGRGKPWYPKSTDVTIDPDKISLQKIKRAVRANTSPKIRARTWRSILREISPGTELWREAAPETAQYEKEIEIPKGFGKIPPGWNARRLYIELKKMGLSDIDALAQALTVAPWTPGRTSRYLGVVTPAELKKKLTGRHRPTLKDVSPEEWEMVGFQPLKRYEILCYAEGEEAGREWIKAHPIYSRWRYFWNRLKRKLGLIKKSLQMEALPAIKRQMAIQTLAALQGELPMPSLMVGHTPVTRQGFFDFLQSYPNVQLRAMRKKLLQRAAVEKDPAVQKELKKQAARIEAELTLRGAPL